MDTDDEITDLEVLPEFRIYVSSQGGEPMVWDIRGTSALKQAIDAMTERFPNDTIYVREVIESVILVIGPGKHRQILSERYQNRLAD